MYFTLKAAHYIVRSIAIQSQLVGLPEKQTFKTIPYSFVAAGDCRRGQSLVVWGINEGRGATDAIDSFLKG